MKFSVLTYNTLFNRAIVKIEPVIAHHKPDILCLQEVNTEEKNLKSIERLGFKLAEFSNSFIKFGTIYGVATFYNTKRFKHIKSIPLHPDTNLTELLFQLFQSILGYNKPKTFLESNFKDKKTGKTVNICNIHFYVIGSNQLRLKHIKEVIENIGAKAGEPVILAGDFNYFPYHRRRLENLMKNYKFKEATKNIFQTIKFTKDGLFENFNIFQKVFLRLARKFSVNLKIDYIFYRGLKLVRTKRVEVRYSDHFPIVSTFSTTSLSRRNSD